MAKCLIIQRPVGAVHFLVIYPRMIISYTASSIPPSSRSSLGYTTHFQVGLILHDTSNTFVITSFSCKDFYSKYHLFKSTFLRRLTSISTEQGLFISWGFGPKQHSEYKNKKKWSRGSTSIHGITISKRRDRIYEVKQ